MNVLDDARAETLAALSEAIVPGSARVGPTIYVDALLARMDEPARAAALAAIDALAPAVSDLGAVAATPEFLLVRALAIEAFYSDFVAPGLDAEGAWAEIGFDSSPLAQRVRKDWSYLGITS